jgi:hypothetical protein
MQVCAVLAAFWVVSTAAFQGTTWRRSEAKVVSANHKGSTTLLYAESSRPPFFKDLRNPFAALAKGPRSNPQPGDTFADFDPSPSGLVRRTKLVLATDLGLQDPSLLDDQEFKCISPGLDQPLGKTDYIAAGRFFDLRGTFPDLDYRAHDFRIDETDPKTVRLTCRVTGTMRGELRLRTANLPPTNIVMFCPPEAVSMTFNDQGKVTKLCTGFCMDRQVGNTQGTTGVQAAATIAGQPPSSWELYPGLSVVKRFFGRPVTPIVENNAILAPFPETVMVQLAKGVLGSNMGLEDPTLLSNDFAYSTPFIAPVSKFSFLSNYAAEEFANIDPSLSHFRIDPYNPTRVWVDVKPSAPGYEGAPQSYSFTFDDEGFCTRVTARYVLDPSIGNGGGLGGPDGYKYALNDAPSDLLTRPLPEAVGRFRKKILSPITGVGVDDYKLPGEVKKIIPPKPPTVGPNGKSMAPEPLSKLQSISREPPQQDEGTRKAEQEKRVRAQKRAQQEARLQAEQQQKNQASLSAPSLKKQPSYAKPTLNPMFVNPKATLTAAQKAADSKKLVETRNVETAKKKAEAKRQKKIEQKRVEEEQKRQAVSRDLKQSKSISQEQTRLRKDQDGKDFEKRRRKAEQVKEAAKVAAEDRRKRQEAALDALSRAVKSATISLFRLGSGRDEPDELPEQTPPTSKKAPPGVPAITRWRQNDDGSVTGLISGSLNFRSGERVTTSPISSGKVQAGEVVRTGSGSRYFLA